MAITLVFSAEAASANGLNVTTTADDGTGGDFAIIGSASSNPASLVISDSETNTYTSHTASNSGSVRAQLHSVEDADVGASHTATVGTGGEFPTIFFAIFAGVHLTAGFDQENGGTSASSTTCATGNITPAIGDLMVSVLAVDSADETSYAPSSGWTTFGSGFVEEGNSWGGHAAWKIATTTDAQGCTWTASGGTPATMAARIASFLPADGGGGGGGTTNRFLSLLGAGV